MRNARPMMTLMTSASQHSEKISLLAGNFREWKIDAEDRCPLCPQEAKEQQEHDMSNPSCVVDENTQAQQVQLPAKKSQRQEGSSDNSTANGFRHSPTSPMAVLSSLDPPSTDSRKRKRIDSSISALPPAP